MDIQHRQRPVKPDQSFWDNRRLWTARIFSMFCCAMVVSVVAVFCAFVYLILKEMRNERVIGEDGSEVRLLGFWSVLVMSVLAGFCCCSFTWTITYFDSFEPGTFPPTPLSPAHLRQVTGHSFHMGYSVAVLNGIVAAITIIWSLT
ncbi:ADP-ribosylation factor-like protein 6-interacting protein 6 [Salmo salar]|uniref:ADP-ribosylation factor-like protein 6-interacting protein 6 n=1 Tax=Salmo salar TaxID=8030 RepID=A0A1S3MTF7_SALSA|nr:ADP-ribosylation factor-like protein 6-interacting protein 6 [Salmo salar]XP_014006386.1 ADP-ribosylation factor-like protein 6-interacting protein 6 [Salmo salar]|eukprot:XP_014006385.1 PREDICTED: ADP-ribosylation factor-like protein 6-interacting protein 6 [Salmo salar]